MNAARIGVLALNTLLVGRAHPIGQLQAAEPWPLWESYSAYFIDDHGRVMDRDQDERTTSEGQAYAMFFALVANDRQRFEQILEWTQANLGSGDLSRHLPAWLWGKSGGGHWGVQDSNSASDADLWIAYTLLEGGVHWKESRYCELGAALAGRIADLEVRNLKALGPVLLPAPRGFEPADGVVILNPAYLPLQVLLGLATRLPDGPWKKIASESPKVIRGSAPKGFALDWIGYKAGAGFFVRGPGDTKPLASYDAIRVYLWAGMLDPDTRGRSEILGALNGMSKYMKRRPIPPAEVTAEGAVKNAHGSAGFSAALIPYLTAIKEHKMVEEQQRRLSAESNSVNGLYGSPARYYDQNLALFGTGWAEGRFAFAPDGTLIFGTRR